MAVTMTAGGVQATLAEALSAVATTLSGAPGEANGVTAFDAADEGP